MMKQGEMVALDTTANLLSQFAVKNLRLKLDTSHLPPSLLPMLKHGDNGHFMLNLSQFDDVEFVLGELKKANINIEDMQMIEADLEDVFLSLVGGDA